MHFKKIENLSNPDPLRVETIVTNSLLKILQLEQYETLAIRPQNQVSYTTAISEENQQIFAA